MQKINGMKLQKLKNEFQIRYYIWATSEFKKEIDRSFASLSSFKDGAPWKLCQYMQKLNKDDQLALARGLLKRSHSDAAKLLGESISESEETLLVRDREFNLMQSNLEVEIFKKNLAGEVIQFASKQKLRRTMIAKFKIAFESQCVGSKYLVNEPEPQFQMNCGGWIINTFFSFGRGEGQIEYCHNILSEHSIERSGQKGVYRTPFVMASYVSLCSWLGITSQTQWEYVLREDVDKVCDAAVLLCRLFFEAAPVLLRGLELDRITNE